MSKLEFNVSSDEGIDLRHWIELKDTLDPFAQKCLNGEISKEEYFKICNEEKDKFIKKYSRK